MSLFALFVINRSGGLVFHRDFGSSEIQHLSTNEQLVIAGAFHGVHALTARISPLEQNESVSSGLQYLKTPTFTLYCHQTMTGIKFLFITSPDFPDYQALSTAAYRLYVEFVVKNPFYQPDMPIRIELFDKGITKLGLTYPVK